MDFHILENAFNTTHKPGFDMETMLLCIHKIEAL